MEDVLKKMIHGGKVRVKKLNGQMLSQLLNVCGLTFRD
jgi:hypothetical protein